MSVDSAHAVEVAEPTAREGFVRVDGREMYCIPQFNRLKPFLMTLTSDSDLWMFISSTGGLTAGRIDSSHALFPYETEDRLHRAYGTTGPITLIRVLRGKNQSVFWAPFAPQSESTSIRRNIFKNALGT